MSARLFRPFLATVLLVGGCAMPPESGSLTGTDQSADPTRLGPTVPVSGNRLTPPIYKVGEEWQYSDGYGMRVVELMGNRTKFERLDAPGQWFINQGLFRQESLSGTAMRKTVFNSDDPDRLYQMPMGTPVVYTREYLRDKQTIRHNTSVVVERIENITVPAGTFRAFVVVRRSRSLVSDWTGFERMWYVPEVKNYVRMEYRYGDMPELSRVLMSYKAL